MALVNQAVRPAGAEPIHAVVLVKRDEQNVVTERVLVRLGDTGLYGPTAGTVPAPSNLPTATSGNVSYDRSNRIVRIEFALGPLGNLSLEAYHSDQSSNNALRDELQDIAGALTIWPGGDVRVSSQLPDGWTLAAAGLQPEQVVPSYFQAFETNTADGGPQIIIDNRTIDDPAFPYWEMYQTLQPVEIRGQAGFVTTQAFEIDSRTSTDTLTARTLIWEETPGLWVTLWVAHLTTEQAVAVANNLVAIAPDEWSMSAPPTTSAATTRTST